MMIYEKLSALQVATTFDLGVAHDIHAVENGSGRPGLPVRGNSDSRAGEEESAQRL